MTTRLAAVLLTVSLSVAAAQAPNFIVDKFDIGGGGSAAYMTAEYGTGRVFVARQSRVTVVNGRVGTVIGEIPGTPGVRAIALAPRSGHGFTTNAGDSTVTMFDLQTLAPIRQIKIPAGGLNGIMYEGLSGRIVLTNHSRPRGSATIIDAKDGRVLGSIPLSGTVPTGAVADDRGRVFVSNRTTSTVQVLDINTMKVLHTWPVAPCTNPESVAMDLRTNRLFVACSKRSVAIDAGSGKVVASWANGDGVDGLAWDGGDYLMYIPSGVSGNITVVRMTSPNSYSVVSTVVTVPGARTLAHDPSGRLIYQFQPHDGKSWFVRVSR